VIDQRQDRVDDAVNSLDVIGCCGSCAAPETLVEAETNLADLFIAATGVDEANLIGCQLARKMGARSPAILSLPLSLNTDCKGSSFSRLFQILLVYFCRM
jgi:Trk K+ transport system NAD-binding subunit